MLCERKKAILKVIPLREDLSLNIEAFKGLLNAKTRLVSVAHVSNVLGTIQPVEEIIRLAHERKGYLFVLMARKVCRICKWMCRRWIAISWFSQGIRCMVRRVLECCMASESG